MPQLQSKSCNQQTELRHLLRLQEQAYRRMGNKQRADDVETEDDLVEREPSTKAACQEAAPRKQK